jgi:hypothetical protein
MAIPVPNDNPYFELRESSIHGLGAFARKRIRKGTKLIEYVGELISAREGDRRYDPAKMKEHHTFLFAVGKGLAIDAAVGGNASRYLNHACEPNCEALEEEDEPRIFLYAARTIEPDEELVYDYGFRIPRPTKTDIAFYRCACGAPTCRGTTLTLPKKKPARKAAPKSTKKATSKKVEVKKDASSKATSKRSTSKRSTSKKVEVKKGATKKSSAKPKR